MTTTLPHRATSRTWRRKHTDEDPAELICDVLAIEREIAAGLEKLLSEVEQ